jgi:predicted RNA binding protein YcfA (HicA-like mRNA interferase family)
MGQIEKLLNEIYKNPTNVKFTDLCRVCEHYFGKARQSGSSHRIYKTPWQGDPRVNIQNNKGKAKAYQVKQVIKAIERLEEESDTTK